jgi:signal peptide peptidase SppA
MSKHTYDHLLAFAVSSPWALEPEMLAVVTSILSRRIAGEEADIVALVPKKREGPAVTNGVAVLPMHGVFAPRANMLSNVSGGMTFEQATQDLREAVASNNVGTVVLDWDSPGGNVQGATEFAREMLKARAVKPVISQANHRMCSAAYWTGSCATEVVASPSSVVGALGVYTIHDDLSGALAQLGVKRSYLAKGRLKVDGNETEPLSDETKARWLDELDKPYGRMLKDVAAGRGVPIAAVRAGYGEGRAVQAEDALALGMIDRIGTLDDTIARAMTTTAPAPSLVHATGPETPPTSQEPLEVTEAARAADRSWRTSIERQLLQLTLG